jgi:hypothetical protein
MAQYTVQAPDGNTITLEGPEGASQADVIAKAQELYKAESVKFKATPENRGNIINTDVPTVVGEQSNAVNLQPQARTVSMMDRVKALYEVPTTIVSEAVRQPIAQAYGIARSIPEAISTGQAPAPLGQKYVNQALQNIPQYQPTSPVTQEALSAIGGAFEAAKIPPYIGNIGAIPSFTQAASGGRPVVNNMANALRDEASMVGQSLQPVVNKVTQAVEPATTRIAQALRSEPKIDIAGIGKTAPSAEDLATQSSNLFKTAKESGVELNAKDFSTNMANIGKELRNEGYDPRLYPKLAVALDEMTKAGIPKDFNELSTLRKFIQSAQKSVDPSEKRLATILKDDFDNYVSNIPASSVISGNKEGLDAWKKARDTYSRMSKSEVFTDMLEIAELEKTQFSASGAENSLSKQLRSLAKNEKKMRLFTKDEQAAIKQAAKGTNTQNIMRIFGKFAPTSSVSTILPLLATSISGPVGLALTAGSMGARMAATKMRKTDVNQLAAMMRAGKQAPTQ